MVKARAQRRNRFYKARREAPGPAAEILESMWGDVLWKLKLAAEAAAAVAAPPKGEKAAPKEKKEKKEKK